MIKSEMSHAPTTLSYSNRPYSETSDYWGNYNILSETENMTCILILKSRTAVYKPKKVRI